MKAIGPDRYKITFDPSNFAVVCSKGTAKFSGLATSTIPKLYIVAIDERPIYVGTTRQPIRSRLRGGWNAKGDPGYYGYSWRHHFTEGTIDIWGFADVQDKNFLETIEAEIVFLIRRAGQWPEGQTEIHFHPSSTDHRNLAASIVSEYPALSAVR